MRLYLQNIIDNISFENLPVKWQGFDFARFSKDFRKNEKLRSKARQKTQCKRKNYQNNITTA